MCREFVLIKGLLLTWLLLASALSDPNTEPYNSNYNRFRQKIPRIGRRGEGIIAEYMDSDSFPHEGSLSNFFLKASKAVPRLGRRKDISTEGLSREVPILNQKQDVWPNFDEFIDGPNKEQNLPGSRISQDLQENYIRELIHSWINQNENLHENQ